MIEQDFYDQLNVSEAGRDYIALVESCKSRALIPEPGYEIHHRFPTSLGGLNVNANKVKFTVFEHCKAHALLAKAIPCYKTLQPITYMSVAQVQKLEDLEKVTLEDIFEWSKLREKALHHPKSPEHVEKFRQTLKAKGMKRSPEHIEKMSRKGMIAVNDGEHSCLIYPDQLQEYLDKGWVRGRTQKVKEKLSNAHRGLSGTSTGRKVIHFGEKERKVKPEEIQAFLDQGWSLGRAEGFAARHAVKMEGKFSTGRIRIRKDGIGRVVKPEDLQSYLDQGWKLGIVRHK